MSFDEHFQLHDDCQRRVAEIIVRHIRWSLCVVFLNDPFMMTVWIFFALCFCLSLYSALDFRQVVFCQF